MLKIVIDTNVCISALLKQGNSQRILELLTQDIFQFFYPEALLEELVDVATRPKIAVKYNVTPEKLNKLMAIIKRHAKRITINNIPSICRDPDDDVFLECARLANCDYLITGDSDLLELSKHEKTILVSPKQFITILGKQL